MKGLINSCRLILTTMFMFLFIKASDAGNLEMERACSSIPGFKECKRMTKQSFRVIIEDQDLKHDYDRYGEMLCYGGYNKFGVNRGYAINFINTNQIELAKFKCDYRHPLS